MFLDSFRQGWFRSLDRGDRAELLAHWTRLSDDSLRRRFLRPMRRPDLEAQADRALSRGSEVIGWYLHGTLRAVTEVYLDAEAAEAAFSVEAAHRGQGIGRRLLDHALRRARNRGCRSLIVMTTRDNQPMIHLARSAGARIETDGIEVTGRFPLARASLTTHLADLGEEEAGMFQGLAEQAGRMAAAWMPWLPAGSRR